MAATEQHQSMVLREQGSEGAGANGNGSHKSNRDDKAHARTGNGARGSASSAASPVTAGKPLMLLPGTQAEADRKAADIKGHGVRGVLRSLAVARVLGMLSLYLFLNDYDIRRSFNRRISERLREEARERGRVALFQEWSREVDRRALDLFFRGLRFLVFRGAEGTANKEARLEKQAVWLKENLIALGPTFIKIGQSLGTRGDLLDRK